MSDHLQPNRRALAPKTLGRAARLLAVLFSLLAVAAPAQDSVSAFAVVAEPQAFSPDSDGIQDVLQIKLRGVPAGFAEPFDWYCRIVDSGGRVVRSFVADRRLRRPDPAPGNLWLPGRDSIEPIRLFQEILWDGRDASGAFVSDGEYRIEVGVQRGVGEVHVSPQAATAVVSREKPSVEVKAVSSWFIHPPGSARPGRSDRERLELRQSARLPRGGEFIGRLQSLDRGLIQERRWQGQAPSALYVYWDDVQSEGEARYGDYSYSLVARDVAGNQAMASVFDFAYYPERFALDLRSDRSAFSPNGDGLRDSIRFQLWPVDDRGAPRTRSLLRQIRGWRLRVVEAASNQPLMQRSGNGAPPEEIEWDGKDDGGRTVAEGLYALQLEAEIAGGPWRTPWRRVRVDLSPPQASLQFDPKELIPERPDRPGWIGVSFVPSDVSGIESWQLRILLEPDSDRPQRLQQAFRTYRGTFAPERILWNGVSDQGAPAESLERFVVEYTAIDGAGNSVTRRGSEIVSEVLFRPLKEASAELVARIPARGRFEEDGSLKGSGERALDRILERLPRYPRYRLSIESHMPLPGREESNMLTSEKRARAMFEYLRARGVDREQIEFRGFGETEPQMPRSDNFSNYRNERIEARLLLRPEFTPSFE